MFFTVVVSSLAGLAILLTTPVGGGAAVQGRRRT
jgi:hypothetical protein